MGVTIGDMIQFSGIVENYARKDGSVDFGIIAAQDSVQKCVEAIGS